MGIIDATAAQKILGDRYLTVKPKYVPFFFDDFLSDPRVNELEPEQQQQFLYLLVWMMRNEAQIAENHKTIARILGLKSIKAAENLISRLKTVGLLVASATGHKLMALSSPRLLKEYRLAAHKTQVAVEKSRKAINARWSGKSQNDDTGSNTTSIPEVFPENTSLNTPNNTDVDLEVLPLKDFTNILQNSDTNPAADTPVSLSVTPSPEQLPKKKKKTIQSAEQREAGAGVVGAAQSPHGVKGSRNLPRTKDAPPWNTGMTLQPGMLVYTKGTTRAMTGIIHAIDGGTISLQAARKGSDSKKAFTTVALADLIPVDVVKGRKCKQSTA